MVVSRGRLGGGRSWTRHGATCGLFNYLRIAGGHSGPPLHRIFYWIEGCTKHDRMRNPDLFANHQHLLNCVSTGAVHITQPHVDCSKFCVPLKHHAHSAVSIDVTIPSFRCFCDIHRCVYIFWKPSNFTVEIMTLLTTFDSPVYHMHC